MELGKEQQNAFETLKQALPSTHVLAIPDKTSTFILDTDASDKAIGAELIQIQNGVERVVAYGSFMLSPVQRKYCTTRKELLAVVRFTQHFKRYLLGREFIVRTDHNSLRWLLNFRDLQGQLARWLEVLSQYTMKIQHISGSKHVNADVLSRYQPGTPCQGMLIHTDPLDLPCQGCAHCIKVHCRWSTFVTDINDIVPLAKVAVKSCTISNPLNKALRDTVVKKLVRIHAQIDQTEKMKEETLHNWSKVRNMVTSQTSKKDSNHQIRNKVDHMFKTVTNLAIQLEDMIFQQDDTDLGGFMDQMRRQLSLLDRQIQQLKTAITGKLRRGTNTKTELGRLEPIKKQPEVTES